VTEATTLQDEVIEASRAWAATDREVATLYHAYNEAMSAALRDPARKAAAAETFARLRSVEKLRDEALQRWKRAAQRLLQVDAGHMP
jgi:hypothetical protein